MSPNEEGRLDSWKEIAEYLGRDVHTCLRWEKEKGLPVHTIPGGKRRTVYAYKGEIDEWLAKAPVADEVSAQGELEVRPASQQIPYWRRIPLAVRAGLAILVLGLAALGGAYVVKELREPALTSVWRQGSRLVTISPNSSIAWTHNFTPSAQILDAVLLPAGRYGRSPGVLVIVALGEGQGDVAYFFSPRGEVLWQYPSNDTYSFGAENYKLSFGFHRDAIIELGGETKILLDTRDHTWWPSQLVVLNLDGKVEQRFVNSGWINSAYLMHGPLGPVIVVGGVTTSYDGAFLAILDANHISGTSPEREGSPYQCKNCPAGQPLKYFVFPRSELNIFTASLLIPGNGFLQGDIIPIVKPELGGDLGQGPPSSIYEFSPDFQLLRANFDDRYWSWHRKLETEGTIKHSREQCPERNGPPRVLQWTPQEGWCELYPNGPDATDKTARDAHKR